MTLFKLSRFTHHIQRFFARETKLKMKYLCVAEKNDAAKNIASILSRGTSTRKEGLSKFNKIYTFSHDVNGMPADCVMTSVSGHLLQYVFNAAYKNWKSCSPIELFDAPVHKVCPEDYQKIKKTLERELRFCNGLIIWTDCDREGENIGYEIIQVCQDLKPNIPIFRAKFSEITARSITRAMNNLERPNKNISDAVNVRSEVDLRTGAAFTRLQTLRLTKVFPDVLQQKLISYGSCQFPTLGFVVERFKAIESFISEKFWHIQMAHTIKKITTDFTWKRNRLFEKNAVLALLDLCLQANLAKIESVESKPKSKWRPVPLDTIEMEKTVSRKLRINAKETMKIAEKLYTSGFISYPRTETNIFPKEMNLTSIVEQQTEDQHWGAFASRILEEGGPSPRQGKKSDQAHPPIHPTKYTKNLQGNEKKIYEYIVRHFLACVQKDAKGHETIVQADCGGEKFTAKGLVILEKNYLDVYTYENWNGKEIHEYQVGDTFVPTRLELGEGCTSPPKLLTEADLIALMEKHGIGTDATHAEHIETIKSRDYVSLQQNIYFVPAALGMGLVEGYNNMELEISLAKPNLRSDFENDLKLICDGQKRAEDVLRDQIAKYKEVYRIVAEKMETIDGTLRHRLNREPRPYEEDQISRPMDRYVLKCPKCGNDMQLRQRPNGAGWYLGCNNYPNCKNAAWFSGVSNAQVTEETCPDCGPNVKKVKMTFGQNPFLGEPNPNTICIGGCDMAVLTALNINPSTVQKVTCTNDPAGSTNRNNQNGRPGGNNGNDNNGTSQKPSNPPPPSKPKTKPLLPNQSTITSWMGGSPSTPTIPIPRPPISRRPFGSTGNSPDDDRLADTQICNCNKEAIVLTCRNGANAGRQFYKCGSSTGCNYFAWKDVGQSSNASKGQITSSNNENESEESATCQCGLPTVTRTVNKEGQNKGRLFRSCPKSMGESCKFFEWADQDNRESSRKPSYTKKRRRGADASTNSTPDGVGKRPKRKCGICHQEGHTRTRCPRKGENDYI